MNCDDLKNFLDGYLDGELDLVRSLEVERHLAECPACARSQEQRRTFLAALRGAPLRFSPPPFLEGDIRAKLGLDARKVSGEGAGSPPRLLLRDRRSFFWGLFSGAALAGLLAVLTPPATGPRGDEALVQDLVAGHVRSLMAEHLVDVKTSNQHVVKPWFNGRLDFSPPVSDFSGRGFPLAGGRLDYVGGHPAAVLVYHRALHPINLFIWPAAASAAGETAEARQGYHLLLWTRGGMRYALVSDLNFEELKDFAGFLREENR